MVSVFIVISDALIYPGHCHILVLHPRSIGCYMQIQCCAQRCLWVYGPYTVIVGGSHEPSTDISHLLMLLRNNGAFRLLTVLPGGLNYQISYNPCHRLVQVRLECALETHDPLCCVSLIALGCEVV